MKNEMQDVIIVDEEGQEFILKLYKEFSYKDKNYVILFEEEATETTETEQTGENVYLMEVISTEQGEEYLEIEDSKLFSELITEAEKLLFTN